jgi:hypothetical protein
VEQSNRAHQAAQAKTEAGAERHRQPWLEADMKILADPALTILEKAIALHRTYYAVYDALAAYGFRPEASAGTKPQWSITFPTGGQS